VSISAIVVAAGRGTRLGAQTAKAFVSLAGVPMVTYALRTLVRVPSLSSITLVVGGDEIERATRVVDSCGPWPLPIRLVPGGAARQDSVAAGLELVASDDDLVIVHDAARPFASLACITACVAAATETGAAIVALAVRDTVKLVDETGVIQRTLDRQRVWLAQTPQVFRAAVLRRAYALARRDAYHGTDDAALVERLGVPVHIVPGETTNLKITTPDDLQWAEWYLHTQGHTQL